MIESNFDLMKKLYRLAFFTELAIPATILPTRPEPHRSLLGQVALLLPQFLDVVESWASSKPLKNLFNGGPFHAFKPSPDGGLRRKSCRWIAAIALACQILRVQPITTR